MSDSEYSSSSSSEDEEERAKPTFIPKIQRTVLQERTEKEASLQESQKLREEQIRAAQTKDREDAIVRAAQETDDAALGRVHEFGTGISEPILKAPPIGEEDTPEEYQKWQLRELKRLLAYKKTGCFVQEDD